jgi:hypothetical protein
LLWRALPERWASQKGGHVRRYKSFVFCAGLFLPVFAGASIYWELSKAAPCLTQSPFGHDGGGRCNLNTAMPATTTLMLPTAMLHQANACDATDAHLMRPGTQTQRRDPCATVPLPMLGRVVAAITIPSSRVGSDMLAWLALPMLLASHDLLCVRHNQSCDAPVIHKAVCGLLCMRLPCALG